MTEFRGVKALEMWCRRMVEGYPGVKIENMTTSWRDGLAFCAIIHHFRPDLIDFSKLRKNDIYYNNQLAFTVAEKHLGISSLLEAADMVEYEVPDRLSILTYVAQFHRAFATTQGSNATRMVPKRPAASLSPERGTVSPVSTSPPTKIFTRPTGPSLSLKRDPCSKCGLPVSIAERLNVDKALFHRTCFRCSLCERQLSTGDFIGNESREGYRCSDGCKAQNRELSLRTDDTKINLLKPLTMENSPKDSSGDVASKLSPLSFQNSTYVTARSRFLETQVDGDKVPELPKSKPPELESDSATKVLNDSEVNSDVCALDVGTKDSFVSVKRDVKLKQIDILSSEVMKQTSSPIMPNTFKRLNEGSIDQLSPILTVSSSMPDNEIEQSEITRSDTHSIIEISSEIKNEDFNNSTRLLSTECMDEIGHIEISKPESVVEISSETSKEDVISSIEQKSDEVEIMQSESVTEISSDDSKIILIESTLSEPKESQKETISECDPSTNDSALDIESKDDLSSSIMSQPPVSLNPFDGDDEEENSEDIERKLEKPVPMARKSYVSKTKSLNPFETESDEDTEALSKPVPAMRQKKVETKDEVKSLNPFDEDDDIEEIAPIAKTRVLKVVKASKISLGFDTISADDSKEKEDLDKKGLKKLIAPRISLTPYGENFEPTLKPRKTRANLDGGAVISESPQIQDQSASAFGSNSSLSSATSGGQSSVRKKKPAPRPPLVSPEKGSGSAHSSVTSSPSASAQHSPRLSASKNRKAKRAPPPPIMSPVARSELTFIEEQNLSRWEEAKSLKDEENRTRRESPTSENHPPEDNDNYDSISTARSSTSSSSDKKKKKGPAPSRPTPQRRQLKILPMAEIQKEAEEIELQVRGLEKQGVRLEEIIRERYEGPNADDLNESETIEVEDLMLQLFEVVNEKNELCRRKATLMYLRRQHLLEEQYVDVEYQIRCLMLQPEVTKTDLMKLKEEELITQLVQIVEKRNEIIECLEMDRVRERSEDESIFDSMKSYAAKRDESKSKKDKDKDKDEKERKAKNLKKMLKLKFSKKTDLDKDVDESEESTSLPSKEKEGKKKKKKFALFPV